MLSRQFRNFIFVQFNFEFNANTRVNTRKLISTFGLENKEGWTNQSSIPGLHD